MAGLWARMRASYAASTASFEAGGSVAFTSAGVEYTGYGAGLQALALALFAVMLSGVIGAMSLPLLIAAVWVVLHVTVVAVLYRRAKAVRVVLGPDGLTVVNLLSTRRLGWQRIERIHRSWLSSLMSDRLPERLVVRTARWRHPVTATRSQGSRCLQMRVFAAHCTQHGVPYFDQPERDPCPEVSLLPAKAWWRPMGRRAQVSPTPGVAPIAGPAPPTKWS